MAVAFLRIGKKYRSIVTGKIYQIKMIKDQMVVLESENGLNQVLTNKENLYLFYTVISNEEDHQSNLGGGILLPKK